MDDFPVGAARASEENPLLVPPVADDDMMTLAIHREGEAATVTVGGEIDLVSVPRLSAAMAAEIDAGPEVLVVDLDQVTFFPSMGLRALALAQRVAQERGVDLRVVVASSRATLRLLQISGMTDSVVIYASRDDALAGCSTADKGAVPPRPT